MSQSSSSSVAGIGLIGALGLLFVGLKLGHVIDWPWVWVLAPFWVGPTTVLVVLLLGMLVAIAMTITGAKRP